MPSDLHQSPVNPNIDTHSQTPLLHTGNGTPNGNGQQTRLSYDSPRMRPTLPKKHSTFREQDPSSTDAAAATKKRYTYAAVFLGISLVTFAVQTETAYYIQHALGWKKPYCMLYLTHGSWSFLWPTQLLILRIQKWNMPWKAFWRRHVQILQSTAQMTEHRTLYLSPRQSSKSPVPYMIKAVALTTCALTIAGGSWYVAVDMTTTSDLSAIYNCSAFFAYAFSIPLLHEKIRLSKVVAVIIAIVGVLIIVYGDTEPSSEGGNGSGGETGGPDSAPVDDGNVDVKAGDSASNRALGNIVIGIGSVLYGFYEVLYKKIACPPDGTSAGRGMIFANTVGSCIGCFTLLVLWIPLPILHFVGMETFELPRGEAAYMMAISALANATFSGSFLVLISLTSPVLSSVAALLTVFIVAIVAQLLPPPLYSPLSFAAIVGGFLIIGAFLVLSWATYKEMQEEEQRKKMENEDVSESEIDD